MQDAEIRQLTVDDRIVDAVRELDDATFREVYRRLGTREAEHRYRGRVLAKRWRVLQERGVLGGETERTRPTDERN